MVKRKWEKFHTSYSSVEMDKPAPAGEETSLQKDWQRAAKNVSGQRNVLINGIPLSEYARNYHDFATTDDVSNFFKEVILKDMTTASEVQKAQMVEFLKKTFHQGGLMHPASAPFATILQEKDTELDMMVPYATVKSEDMDTKINIQTTPTGFKIQEITSVNSLLAISDEGFKMVKGERNDDQKYTILPDSGNDYIVKLQGTLDINLTQDPANPAVTNPTITVESNMISYGNKDIQNKIDRRDIGQLIVDFFKNIFGLTKVQDLSDKIAEENKQRLGENVELDNPTCGL